MDVSGPYGDPPHLWETYIVSFLDWLTNWPEVYPVPDKKVQIVANLVMSELFSRYGAPVKLVNGQENVKRIIVEVLSNLNTVQIATCFYRPQGNVKVEMFHRTLGEVLAKLSRENTENWDPYLTQALAAVKFTINEIY